MPRVLAHICCGPCAAYTLQQLLDDGFEVMGFFYNPNIHPLQEYLRRREAAAEVCDRLGVKVIWKDADYNPQTWFREITFREANRCFHCYRLRLEPALHAAQRGGFDLFTTTLLYSKHQKHEVIAGLCKDMAEGGKTAFLYRDFREGWQQGIETSKEWGIYRQQYCGCLYSEYERYGRELNALSADEIKK